MVSLGEIPGQAGNDEGEIPGQARNEEGATGRPFDGLRDRPGKRQATGLLMPNNAYLCKIDRFLHVLMLGRNDKKIWLEKSMAEVTKMARNVPRDVLEHG